MWWQQLSPQIFQDFSPPFVLRFCDAYLYQQNPLECSPGRQTTYSDLGLVNLRRHSPSAHPFGPLRPKLTSSSPNTDSLDNVYSSSNALQSSVLALGPIYTQIMSSWAQNPYNSNPYININRILIKKLYVLLYIYSLLRVHFFLISIKTHGFEFLNNIGGFGCPN